MVDGLEGVQPSLNLDTKAAITGNPRKEAAPLIRVCCLRLCGVLLQEHGQGEQVVVGPGQMRSQHQRQGCGGGGGHKRQGFMSHDMYMINPKMPKLAGKCPVTDCYHEHCTPEFLTPKKCPHSTV